MRTTWRGCAAAGIVAFVCSWAFGQIPGLVACGPAGDLGPIIAFEFARTPADVAALFGTAPCTATLVAAQKTGLLLDGLGFIPSYTAFLVLAVLAAGTRGWLRATAVAALLVAGLADEIEGFLLNALLDRLPGTPALLHALWWAVHAKFLLLALGTIQIGGALAAGSWPGRIVGAVILLGGGIALLCLLVGSSLMMQGFLVGWTVLLLAALTASFWPRVFSSGS